MAYDPLAPFRRGSKQPEPKRGLEQAQGSDEHRALRAAIDALHQLPDSPLSGDYKSTHALLPVLETAYQNAERELEQHRGFTPTTDVQIEAAVEHDIHLFEAVRQDWQEEQGVKPEPAEPPMTEAELEKAAHAAQLLADAIQARQRQDREPEM